MLLAVFNDGAMIALSQDRVTPSPAPNMWRLRNIFALGIVYGLYLTLSTWVLFHVSQGLGFRGFCGQPVITSLSVLCVSVCNLV